jgi:hypothetical protein
MESKKTSKAPTQCHKGCVFCSFGMPEEAEKQKVVISGIM